MKADILERSTAFNIYEGIVNRRKDPSVLYKNQEDAYEFRIFPLPGQKAGRSNLLFSLPLMKMKLLNCRLPSFL